MAKSKQRAGYDRLAHACDVAATVCPNPLLKIDLQAAAALIRELEQKGYDFNLWWAAKMADGQVANIAASASTADQDAAKE